MDKQEHFKALPLNTILDNKYELINILGSGGFGITYLANFIKLDSKVVIKEYFPSDLAHRDENSTIVPFNTEVSDFYEKGKERFLFEAKTIAKFKHQNIVKILDYFETNNTAYFVMEYEEGKDLGHYLKSIKKNLSEEEIFNIIMPILDGLREIHSKNIYHRDIKPDNIYMRTSAAPLLIDFGAAKESYQDGSKASSMNAQTAGYAAPEQKSSIAKYIGPYTDLYAIGSVLHKMVTGKTPPTADDRSISRDNEGFDSYKPLVEQNIKGYSKQFLENIDWALQFLSKDRPQTAKEFQTALMQKEIAKREEPKSKQEPKKQEEKLKPKVQEEPKEEKQQNKLLPIIIGIVILIAGIVFYQIQQSNIEKENINGWNKSIFRGKRSYSKNTQNTVKDNLMGVIWQKGRSDSSMKWSDAKEYCKDLSLDNYSDWRLPGYRELYYLADRTKYYPAIDQKYFTESSECYWSSTKYKNDSSKAWYVLFFYGDDYYDYKSNKEYVRCVRGGQ